MMKMSEKRKKEIKYIKKHYGEMTAKELGEALGLPVTTINGITQRHGIRSAVHKRENDSTLCWSCYYATNINGKCSWSRALVPVAGWEASEVKIKDNWRGYFTSFKITKCPIYKKG